MTGCNRWQRWLPSPVCPKLGLKSGVSRRQRCARLTLPRRTIRRRNLRRPKWLSQRLRLPGPGVARTSDAAHWFSPGRASRATRSPGNRRWTGQFVIGLWLASVRAQIGRPIDEVAVDDPLRKQFNMLHEYSTWVLFVGMGAAFVAFFIIANRKFGAVTTKKADVYDFSKEFKT